MSKNQDLIERLLVTVMEMCEGCAADGKVEECLGEDCSLFSMRLGNIPGRRPQTTMLKAIRDRCLDCMNDQAREVLCCGSLRCPLWPWREGTGIPSRPDHPKGIDAFLFGDQDPDELTVNEILFGED